MNLSYKAIMAHFLMIESWVGASGKLLPPLLKSLGHTYTFITRKSQHYKTESGGEEHPVLKYADEVVVTETNEIDNLIEVLNPYKFDSVITVCDYYIEIVAEVAKKFGVPCPFPKNVGNIRRKHDLRKAIDLAGLNNPKYRLAKSLDDVKAAAKELGFPFVIKPVDLASSAFVRLIRNEKDLEDAFNRLAAFPLNFRDQTRDCTLLLEEYMEGEEFSVEGVSFGDKTTIIGITDKSVMGEPYFIESGHMFPADLNNDEYEIITGYVKKVLKAVNFNCGISHTEIKLTNEGPKIVEINPRTAGNYIVELVEYVTNINLLKVFVDLALGISPDVRMKGSDIVSAAIAFIVPQKQGMVEKITGLDKLENNTHILRYQIEDRLGKQIPVPIDNDCYLGYVISKDNDGFKSREYAERAIDDIVFHLK